MSNGPNKFIDTDWSHFHFGAGVLRRRLKGDFREQDHPRADDGKWGGGAKPGAAGGAALPETADEAHRLAQEKARGWLKKLAGLPAATVELAAGKARKLYDRMAAKYGKGWARAIVSVGVVTFPTPFTAGAVLATIGLAKLCLKLSGREATPAAVRALLVRLRKAMGNDNDNDKDGEDIDMELAFARAGRFVAALTASLEGAAEGLDAGARRQLDTVAESLGGEDAE
jgi:hypothetical protein